MSEEYQDYQSYSGADYAYYYGGGGNYYNGGGDYTDPNYGNYGNSDPYTPVTNDPVQTTSAVDRTERGGDTGRTSTSNRTSSVDPARANEQAIQNTIANTINSIRVADLVSGLLPTGLQLSGEEPDSPSIVVDGQVKEGGYGITFPQLIILVLVLGGVLYGVAKFSR